MILGENVKLANLQANSYPPHTPSILPGVGYHFTSGEISFQFMAPQPGKGP